MIRDTPKASVYILVPGLSERFQSGGLLTIRSVAEIFEKRLGQKAQFVVTEETPAPTDTNTASAAAFFSSKILNPQPGALFIVTWGPLVEKHIRLIRARHPQARILYYAQSFGWNIRVPKDVPIVCVSRYIMAQWALHAPENSIAYIPPPLNPCFRLENRARDIDILIHTRKQNEYCLKKLLPALQTARYKLQILTDWIPQQQFAALLNRTKIFLYITAPHKAGLIRRLRGEGFGLPALEALVCGALVGSNLLGGVTDFLTPGENAIKLGRGLETDLRHIRAALENFRPDETAARDTASRYSFETAAQKWRRYLGNT